MRISDWSSDVCSSDLELYVRDLQQPGSRIVPVVRNMDNEHGVITNRDSLLYILTNLGAPNQKVVTTVFGAHQPDNWNVLIPETENVLSISTGAGKLFARYLKDATSLVQLGRASCRERVCQYV